MLFVCPKELFNVNEIEIYAVTHKELNIDLKQKGYNKKGIYTSVTSPSKVKEISYKCILLTVANTKNSERNRETYLTICVGMAALWLNPLPVFFVTLRFV